MYGTCSHCLNDVRACYWLTCQKWHANGCHPISWMVGPPHSVLGGGCRLICALPGRCYVRHTCSLYGGQWIEMPASFLSMQPCVLLTCQVWLLLIIIVTAGVSVSAETRKPIYRIHRYCNAASTHSPIYDIGLTLSKVLAQRGGMLVSVKVDDVHGWSFTQRTG